MEGEVERRAVRFAFRRCLNSLMEPTVGKFETIHLDWLNWRLADWIWFDLVSRDSQPFGRHSRMVWVVLVVEGLEVVEVGKPMLQIHCMDRKMAVVVVVVDAVDSY